MTYVGKRVTTGSFVDATFTGEKPCLGCATLLTVVKRIINAPGIVPAGTNNYSVARDHLATGSTGKVFMIGAVTTFVSAEVDPVTGAVDANAGAPENRVK
jgi:hypothetical protein